MTMREFLFSFVVCNVCIDRNTTTEMDIVLKMGASLGLDALYPKIVAPDLANPNSPDILKLNLVGFYKTVFVIVYMVVVVLGVSIYIARSLPETTRLKIANDALQFFVNHKVRIAEIDQLIAAVLAAPDAAQKQAATDRMQKKAADIRNDALAYITTVLQTHFKMTSGTAGIFQPSFADQNMLLRTSFPSVAGTARFDIDPTNTTTLGRGFAARCWLNRLQATTGYAYLMRKPIRWVNPYAIETNELKTQASQRNFFYICFGVSWTIETTAHRAVICFDFPERARFPKSKSGMKDVAGLLEGLLQYTLEQHLNANDRKQ